MDHDLGLCGRHRARERIGVEHIDEHGLGAQCAELVHLRRRTRRAEHGMPGGAKQRRQAPADGTRGAGEKDAVSHVESPRTVRESVLAGRGALKGQLTRK